MLGRQSSYVAGVRVSGRACMITPEVVIFPNDKERNSTSRHGTVTVEDVRTPLKFGEVPV